LQANMNPLENKTMATGTFTHRSQRTKLTLQRSHKRSENPNIFKPSIHNVVGTGWNNKQKYGFAFAQRAKLGSLGIAIKYSAARIKFLDSEQWLEICFYLSIIAPHRRFKIIASYSDTLITFLQANKSNYISHQLRFPHE